MHCPRPGNSDVVAGAPTTRLLLQPAAAPVPGAFCQWMMIVMNYRTSLHIYALLTLLLLVQYSCSCWHIERTQKSTHMTQRIPNKIKLPKQLEGETLECHMDITQKARQQNKNLALHKKSKHDRLPAEPRTSFGHFASAASNSPSKFWMNLRYFRPCIWNFMRNEPQTSSRYRHV